MAYAMCAESQVKSKSAQYCPEYDYPTYYQKTSESKYSYQPIQNSKKVKKSLPAITYTGERKCPIYVHQYNKIQSSSTYNNHSSRPSKTKKSPPLQITTKSVLDQLEETYWATWKPNKENIGNNARRRKSVEEKINKNKAYGDVSETLVNYFAKADFDTSASAIEDTDSETYNGKLELVTNISDVHDSGKKRRTPETPTSTQEIQTDVCPLILTKIEEHNENNLQVVDVAKTKEDNEKTGVNSEPSQEFEKSIEESESNGEDENKLLHHTDSFILHKKKQSEVKQHYQQPKCIRLFKKPGLSNSFIKGGSYPLRSCLKREPAQKGNFRLGAPGSPLFVTTSSYNRKSRK